MIHVPSPIPFPIFHHDASALPLMAFHPLPYPVFMLYDDISFHLIPLLYHIMIHLPCLYPPFKLHHVSSPFP